MSNTVIKAEGVGKIYSLNHEAKYYDLRDLIVDTPRRIVDTIRNRNKKNRRRVFWALKDVSFSVRKGEVLGIIGRNGAGKTTLLKIFSRIIPPTTGKITIKGHVSSILGVGTGFNSEFTGRENVFLSGAILGMKRREIVSKFDQIVKFAEVNRFINMPVKKYSSGMSVRLAFAIAVHLDPQVLIIDEVLAVGDIAFQRKSLKKMYSLARDEGKTVLFVSHNIATVNSLCDRVILLKRGRLEAVGNTPGVIAKYLDENLSKEDDIELGQLRSRSGSGEIRITDFWIEDDDAKKVKTIFTGGRYRFVFKYRASSGQDQKNVDAGFGLSSSMEQSLFIHYMSFTNQVLKRCPANGLFVFEFDKFPLAKGQYKMSMRVAINGKEADFAINAVTIKVENGDYYKTGVIVDQTHSPFYVEGRWKLIH